MELNRRQFAARISAAALAVAAGTWATLKASPPVRALRHHFPGRVRDLDHKQVRGPGPWAG